MQRGRKHGKGRERVKMGTKYRSGGYCNYNHVTNLFTRQRQEQFEIVQDELG